MENNRTSAAALAALRSASEKRKFQSFKNIPKGEYIVKTFSHVDTIHGKRVQVDMMNGEYMYLPQRYLTLLSEDVCEDLSKSPKIMIYDGKDPDDSNRLILDFKDVNYFNNFMDEVVS